jgi:hypothetical protein
MVSNRAVSSLFMHDMMTVFAIDAIRESPKMPLAAGSWAQFESKQPSGLISAGDRELDSFNESRLGPAGRE